PHRLAHTVCAADRSTIKRGRIPLDGEGVRPRQRLIRRENASSRPIDGKDWAMNRTVHKLCAWSGTLCLVTMVISFVLLAGFIPTRSPSDSALETAQFILGHRDRIRWGMILCMFSASLLMPYAASMAIHMRRIEG